LFLVVASTTQRVSLLDLGGADISSGTQCNGLLRIRKLGNGFTQVQTFEPVKLKAK
jgi:hypothetical protein